MKTYFFLDIVFMNIEEKIVQHWAVYQPAGHVCVQSCHSLSVWLSSHCIYIQCLLLLKPHSKIKEQMNLTITNNETPPHAQSVICSFLNILGNWIGCPEGHTFQTHFDPMKLTVLSNIYPENVNTNPFCGESTSCIHHSKYQIYTSYYIQLQEYTIPPSCHNN